ncbi:MAG: TraR/DksA C4-type zinc finger protein [bacterium]|nr:TraR/DksA C4-type zinc finger protein [bacterium]
MTIDTGQFKARIEDELKTVVAELKTVGRINPDNPLDWESMPGELDIMQADRNEAADKFEEYENNTAILKQLEIRFNELRGALKRIEQGTYGTCTVGGEEIEKERLEANPAATTCMKHLGK